LLPHRFAVALASGGLAVVGGGGGLAKSVEVLYIPVLISPSLNKLPAFFAAILGLSHLCFVHAFAGAVRGGERRRRWVRGAGPLPHLADVRLVGGVGLVGRILAGSGVSFEAPDLVGELFCPSLVLFGDGTAVDVISDEAPGRFVYHCLEGSGEWFHCNCLGGLPFWLLGCSVFWGGRRCLWLRNPSSSATRWPVVIFYCLGVHRLYGMSTSLMCYSAWQTKTLFLRREGLRLQVASLALSSTLVWRRLVGGLLRAPATKMTGRSVAGPKCNFLFFQGCLCKSCNVILIPYM